MQEDTHKTVQKTINFLRAKNINYQITQSFSATKIIIEFKFPSKVRRANIYNPSNIIKISSNKPHIFWECLYSLPDGSSFDLSSYLSSCSSIFPIPWSSVDCTKTGGFRCSILSSDIEPYLLSFLEKSFSSLESISSLIKNKESKIE